MKRFLNYRFSTPPRVVESPPDRKPAEAAAPATTLDVAPASQIAPSSEPRARLSRRPAFPNQELRTHSLERKFEFRFAPLERQVSGDPDLHPDHYMKLPSGYVSSVDGEMVEPTLYQPTPAGLDVLTQYFSHTAGIDLRHFPQENFTKDTIRDRFNHFADAVAGYELKDGQSIGVVLSYGQMHAIPVMLEQRNGAKYLVIFDSTSGPITKQYYHVANRFTDFQVMLNKGTRQADKQSCITDAVEILRVALKTPQVLESVLEKSELQSNAEPEPTGRRKFIQPIKLAQENFHLFTMPEALCFTAQRPTFITDTVQADIDKTIKRGDSSTSLGRELTKHTQISFRPNSRNYFPMNAYLYDASRMHKRIIDEHFSRADQEI